MLNSSRLARITSQFWILIAILKSNNQGYSNNHNPN